MVLNNNYVRLIGMLETNFSFTYEFFGEKFYKSKLAVERRSGTFDHVSIMVSDRTANIRDIEENDGKLVKVTGCLRAHQFIGQDNKKHLEFYVFCQEVSLISYDVVTEMTNSIYLRGTIRNVPNYRITPLGREICDIILEVSRNENKENYRYDKIPCIAWGRAATYVSQKLGIGTKMQLYGRIQSREYTKNYSNGQTEIKSATEVSIAHIATVKELNDN